MQNSTVWTHTYAPRTSREIIGQDKPISQISNFIRDFKNQKKRGLLLHGDHGSGKTSSVHAVAEELGLELIEMNASDFRTSQEINERIGRAIGQMSLFGGGKVILIDEIDGVSGTKDRGGIKAIERLLAKTPYPMVFTATDPWDKKFSGLRKACMLVEFNSLSYVSIYNLLRRICDAESIRFEEEALKGLARRAGGDARAAINDLQMISGGTGQLTKADLDFLAMRNKTEQIHQALTKIFKTRDIEIARTAFDSVNEDLDEAKLWIDENLPAEYTEPHDLARAYERVSKADVYSGRIRRRQHWRFLVYINFLLSAGVAVAKEEKYRHMTQYRQTKRLLVMWQAKMKFKKRESIVEKLAEATHSSKKQARQYHLPYVREMVRRDEKAVAEELELDAEEIKWLRGQ